MSTQNSPQYQLQARNRGPEGLEVEIWQLPSPATPHICKPVRLAGLRGRNLTLVETQLLRQLNKVGIKVAPLAGHTQHFALDEDTSLSLGLLCRVLAPMRNVERMRQVATGVERMDREEAAYWLGMAMHRKNPRRVLGALRLLLTHPA